MEKLIEKYDIFLNEVHLNFSFYSDATCRGHEEFYRDVLMYACGSANIVSLFALSLLVLKSKDQTKRCNALERNRELQILGIFSVVKLIHSPILL